MSARVFCITCGGDRTLRARYCRACRDTLREQQAAAARQSKKQNEPLTLHELTIVLERLQAGRGERASS